MITAADNGSVREARTDPGEDARLGRRIVTTAIIAALATFYVVSAALPARTYPLPFVDNPATIRVIVPEGWAFFTRSPRLPEPAVYLATPGGGWRDITAGPVSVPQTWMGLDRGTRSQGVELANLLTEVSVAQWQACTDRPTVCLSRLRPSTAIVNRSSQHTACGDVGFVVQDVTPWAWHDLHPVMPSKVARVTVRC
jgi:antimicrobial peptide system SdpA family protein